MRRLLLCAASLAVVLVALMPLPARAQSTEILSDADIARARQSQPVITEQDIQRAQRRNRMPTEGELRAVPVPSTPNLDRLPQPQERKPLDLAAIARGYEGAGDRIGQVSANGPGLLVFVSFSMPQQTLERLVEQAARAKATLVLRGFINNSLQETVLRVQRLIGQREVAFQIDPQAFDRFAIVKTPSFVVVREGAQAKPCSSGQCFATDAFVSTAGDVSLDYALEYIQRTAPKFSREAAHFLKRIRG
jgi:conjugal transfer pilus assembly protein TrbC